jgi:hypothetical protein
MFQSENPHVLMKENAAATGQMELLTGLLELDYAELADTLEFAAQGINHE